MGRIELINVDWYKALEKGSNKDGKIPPLSVGMTDVIII
jgi:hypothetical protein